MKRLLVLGLGFTLSLFAQPQKSSDLYLLLPDFLPALAREVQPKELLYTENGLSVVQVDLSKVEKFSLLVHQNYGGCGGFIDVTHEIQRGTSPAQIVWNELRKKSAPERTRNNEVTFQESIQDLVSKASGETWAAFLKELSAFPDRSATTDEGKKAALFLQNRGMKALGQLGGVTSHLIQTEVPPYAKQPSVVVSLEGTNPNLPHVVVGGHMDTFQNQKPGADDDGSGSATVMEILRVIGSERAVFERTIDFVWYAAEERGLVGSSFVVKKYKAEEIPVEAVIQFDMTGFKSPADDKDIYLITDNVNASLNVTLRKLIETYTTASVGETACGYACSDHANWTREGYPAVFPFESSFSNMNKRLHTGDDKIDYLDKEHAKKFAQVGLAFLGEIAHLQSRKPTLK